LYGILLSYDHTTIPGRQKSWRITFASS